VIRYEDLSSPPFEQKVRITRFRREVNGLLQFWGHSPGAITPAGLRSLLHTVRIDRIMSINEQ
jgi:hypothetical protein